MTEKAQMFRSYAENKREFFHVGNIRISSSSNIEVIAASLPRFSAWNQTQRSKHMTGINRAY